MNNLTKLSDYCSGIGALLVGKFHPFERDISINGIKQAVEGLYVFDEVDPLSLLVAGDVLITQHSSIGIEALALGVPIIEIDIGDNGILQSWHTEGVAEKISSYGEMNKIAKVVQGQWDLDLDKVNEWISNNVLNDGDTIGRVLS